MKVMTAAAMGANLATFVDEVRAVGAEPILITSLTRRNFNADNVTLNDTLEPWANGKLWQPDVIECVLHICFSDNCNFSREKDTIARPTQVVHVVCRKDRA
jgi:hypothetical protein